MPNSGSPGPAARPSIIFMPGQMPPESCQPPPEPPSHSPRMARAATSFRSASLSGPVSDCDLAGGPHAGGDDRRQQVGGDGQPRALGDVVHLADDLQPQPRADQPGQHVGRGSGRSLPAPAARSPRRSRPPSAAPGSPWRNRRPRPAWSTSALHFRSTLTSRSTGWSMTRR